MEVEDIASAARQVLRRHVIAPFVPRCVDREYGGFLVEFDDRWRATGPQEKSLEHAARTTLAFALLERALPGEGFAELVRHGCAFLREAMWDAAHGGFFARVDRAGQPLWQGLKHPHAVTYAAEAFLLATPLLPKGEGPRWADRALQWLDDVAWDRTSGGYWGSYRADNVRFLDGARLPTPDGRDIFGLSPGFKEINSQGDAIEMLTRFEAHCPDPRRAARLQFLVELVADRLVQPRGILPYRYWPDWRPAPDLLRVGYQFLMARHLLLSPAMPRSATALERARELTEFCLVAARHPWGGFCFAVTADGRSWPAIGPQGDLRQWWVQLEAVHTLHLLAHAVKDQCARERYLHARDEQWEFLRSTYLDDKHGGTRELPPDQPRGLGDIFGWLRRAPPRALNLKMHCWKDPSHEIGTLLSLISNAAPDASRGHAARATN